MGPAVWRLILTTLLAIPPQRRKTNALPVNDLFHNHPAGNIERSRTFARLGDKPVTGVYTIKTISCVHRRYTLSGKAGRRQLRRLVDNDITCLVNAHTALYRTRCDCRHFCTVTARCGEHSTRNVLKLPGITALAAIRASTFMFLFSMPACSNTRAALPLQVIKSSCAHSHRCDLTPACDCRLHLTCNILRTGRTSTFARLDLLEQFHQPTHSNFLPPTTSAAFLLFTAGVTTATYRPSSWRYFSAPVTGSAAIWWAAMPVRCCSCSLLLTYRLLHLQALCWA